MDKLLIINYLYRARFFYIIPHFYQYVAIMDFVDAEYTDQYSMENIVI